jgi:hypothetical protein
MPQYLENEICKFTPLFEIDYSKKINIISTVLFKLKNFGYKPFLKYVHGVQYLSNVMHKKLPRFHLRLFIDDTIYSDDELMKKLKAIKDIQIVRYSCPNFIVGGFHRGMFGTLVRLFPMFNFKNNDAKHVIITDIDYISERNVEKNILVIKAYLILKKHKKLENLYLICENFGVLGKFGLDENLSLDNYTKNLKIVIPHISAGLIINTKRISMNPLINYLKNIDSNKEVHSLYSKNIKLLYNKFKSNNKKFVFGVDEYFLNNILLPYIDENKLEFCAKIKYNIINIIYDKLFFKKEIRKDFSEKDINFFTTFFNYVLKDIDDFKFMNIRDAFFFIDKYTYYENYKKKKNFSENQIIIFKRLFKFYHFLIDKKINYLNPYYVNFIVNYMKNKIQIDEYQFFFSKKTPIILEEIRI